MAEKPWPNALARVARNRAKISGSFPLGGSSVSAQAIRHFATDACHQVKRKLDIGVMFCDPVDRRELATPTQVETLGASTPTRRVPPSVALEMVCVDCRQTLPRYIRCRIRLPAFNG